MSDRYFYADPEYSTLEQYVCKECGALIGIPQFRYGDESTATIDVLAIHDNWHDRIVDVARQANYSSGMLRPIGKVFQGRM